MASIIFHTIICTLEFALIDVPTSSILQHLVSNFTIAAIAAINVDAKLVDISVLVADCNILTFVDVCTSGCRDPFVALVTFAMRLGIF